MRLFIQIRDGQPYQHPIADWNMNAAFPDIDFDNLPPQFANFIRVTEPDIPVGEYEVPYVSHYDWVDGYVKDIWAVRPMTEEERNAYDAIKYLQAFQQEIDASLSLDASGTAPNVA